MGTSTWLNTYGELEENSSSNPWKSETAREKIKQKQALSPLYRDYQRGTCLKTDAGEAESAQSSRFPVNGNGMKTSGDCKRWRRRKANFELILLPVDMMDISRCVSSTMTWINI